MAKEDPINKTDIFILTGELSGDKLAYDLLQPIHKEYDIEGFIGPYLKKLNIKEVGSIESFSVMGISKPLSSLWKIFKSVSKVLKQIKIKNPKIVMLVDLPDINLHVAKKLRSQGYKGKIIQIVCPTIWAWRKERKKKLEKYYDHLMCLFPFEKELFKNSKLPVSYIGHPLISCPQITNRNKRNIIAIFPGSRKQEIKYLLPNFLKATESFKEFEIHISVAKTSLLKLIKTYSKNYSTTLRLPEEKNQLISEASYALSKNGTINLELALSGLPQITCYNLSSIEKFIFQYFFSLHLTHYSLPNIILKKRIIPELIGPFSNIDNIKKELSILINDSYVKKTMINDYKQLSDHLQNSPSENVSKILENQVYH